MRVISGVSRGCKLLAPEGLNTRPTTDRIKESLFNMLAPELNEDSMFLDLFSGSGAIGIEAISRGIKGAVFVDSCNESIKIINKNLEHTRLSEKATVMNCEAEQAINILSKKNTKFDIIYIDPPYYKDFIKKVVEQILDMQIIKDDGLIVVEQGSKEPLLDIGSLEILKHKKYSTTSLIFLKPKKLEATK